MRFFDRFRKQPSPRTPTPESNPEDFIQAYDANGREVRISKDQWRQEILPGQLKTHWSDVNALYQDIVQALEDGFAADVLVAAEHLMRTQPENAHFVNLYGIALTHNQKLDDAEEILQSYLTKYDRPGFMVTNLAKVYSAKGDTARSEATLWEALTIDPNQGNASDWWAITQFEKGGAEARLEAWRKIAAIDGSWRAQLWLAQDALRNHALDDALTYYRVVLDRAKDQPEALMMISGDLGKNGYLNEMVQLMVPIYDPVQHGPHAGMNLLQAYVELKRYSEGQELLARLFQLNLPPYREHLMRFAEEFDTMRREAREVPTTSNDKIEVSAYLLDVPVWYNGLKDPKWILPKKDETAKSIVFLALAAQAPQPGSTPQQQDENEIGRLTRSIPLLFLESFYFLTAMKPFAVIPVMKGVGPVVTGAGWTAESIKSFARIGGSSSDYIVTGIIREEAETYAITLEIWDGIETRNLKSITHKAGKPELMDIVRKLENNLHDFLKTVPHNTARDAQLIYNWPVPNIAANYLIGLGQSLTLLLAANKAVPQDTLWGERNMIQWPLTLSLEDESQIPRISFLSSLIRNRNYGSEIYKEFQPQIMELFEHANPRMPFYKLSPLAFQLFDMPEQVADKSQSLRQHASGEFAAWLAGLENEVSG